MFGSNHSFYFLFIKKANLAKSLLIIRIYKIIVFFFAIRTQLYIVQNSPFSTADTCIKIFKTEIGRQDFIF